MSVALLFAILICALSANWVIAQNTTEEDDEDDEVNEDYASLGLPGLLGQMVSTLIWVLFGLLVILGTIGIVDIVTDRMKHNWMNLEEFAENPKAMAIFAAGIMISIAIIVHASIAS